jgi:exosortase/archaeosortase family protein
LDGIIYRIIHECTGIFALLVFLGLVSAYPTSAYHKVQGMLLGLPAFYLYSCLRLVILGIIAHIEPSLVELFYLYMMVLINLGFLLFVWIYWLEKVVRRDSFEPMANPHEFFRAFSAHRSPVLCAVGIRGHGLSKHLITYRKYPA